MFLLLPSHLIIAKHFSSTIYPENVINHEQVKIQSAMRKNVVGFFLFLNNFLFHVLNNKNHDLTNNFHYDIIH